jgi:hypothetical protein
MHPSDPEIHHPSSAGLADVAERPLIDVFLARRSRRFAMGSNLHGGAMDFTSAVADRSPRPSVRPMPDRSRRTGGTSWASSRARSSAGARTCRPSRRTSLAWRAFRRVIVWPDSDPGFGDPELRRWQTLYPAAPVVHLRKVGQFIDEDAPEDVASAIRDLWAKGPGAPVPGGDTAPS